MAVTLVGKVTRQLSFPGRRALAQGALDTLGVTRYTPLLLVTYDTLNSAKCAGFTRRRRPAQGRIGVCRVVAGDATDVRVVSVFVIICMTMTEWQTGVLM